MTCVAYARRVLDDVKHIRKRLEYEVGEREWRLAWVLAIVLLRTIGDVLHKVDGAANSKVKEASSALYDTWKSGAENAIFREFIKLERDSVVHEYATAMTAGPISIMAVDENPDGREDIGQFLLDEIYTAP